MYVIASIIIIVVILAALVIIINRKSPLIPQSGRSPPASHRGCYSHMLFVITVRDMWLQQATLAHLVRGGDDL